MSPSPTNHHHHRPDYNAGWHDGQAAAAAAKRPSVRLAKIGLFTAPADEYGQGFRDGEAAGLADRLQKGKA